MSEKPLEEVVRRLRGAAQSPRPEDLADGDLLRRFAAARDDLAFAEVVRRHGPLVLRVCARTLRDSHRAEDAFQATFLVLSRRAGSLRRPELLSNWLYGVAIRVSREARLRALRKERRERRLTDLQEPQAEPTTDCSELARVLDEEVSRLPEKYRTAFVLCCLEGKTHEQAATALRCPVGSMSWRLDKARELLRQRLTRRGITVTAALSAVSIAPAPSSAAVPAALGSATVRAALLFSAGKGAVDAAASVEAVALARSVLRGVTFTKQVMAAVLLLGIAGAGSAALTYRAPVKRAEQSHLAIIDDKASPPAPLSGKPTETVPTAFDRYGDPLPAGAFMRLGTLRFHHPGQTGPFLAYSGDGREIVSVDRDGWIIRWDPSTGKQLLRVKADQGHTDELALSAEGRYAAFPNYSEIPIWDTVRGVRMCKIPSGELSAVGLSADGSVLACMHEERPLDNRVHHFIVLWDVASRREIQRIPWNEDSPGVPVFSAHAPRLLLFSPDGKTLATIAATVRFWDVSTGRQKLVLKPPPGDMILGAAYSPDGALFAGWAAGGLFKGKSGDHLAVWDSATGGLRFRVQDDRRETFLFRRTVAFSKDGKQLASAGCGVIRIWDVGTAKNLHCLEVSRRLTEVALAPDGKTIACTGWDGVLHRFNLDTGDELGSIDFIGAVESLAFSPNGKTIVSAHGDDEERHSSYTLHEWDAATGREVGTIGKRGQALSRATFSPDGKLLAASAPRGIVIWDSASRRELRTLPTDATRWDLCTFSDDGKLLYARTTKYPMSASSPAIKSTLRCWEVDTGRQHFERVYEERPRLFGPAAFSEAARVLISPVGIVRHVPDLEHTFVLEAPDPTLYRQYRSPAFSTDGRLFAAWAQLDKHDMAKGSYGEGYQELVVWELASGKIIRSFPDDPNIGGFDRLAFSRDGRTLAGAASALIRVWDLESGRVLLDRKGPGSWITAFGLSPDGRTLATGLGDSTVLLWDISPAVAAARTKTAKPIAPEKVLALWNDLAAEDAAKGQAAVYGFASAPKDSVPFLRERLRPEPSVTSDEIRRLISQLDSGRFQGREDAFHRLQRLAEVAEPALQEALKHKPSAEAAERIGKLLNEVAVVHSPEVLRGIRAIRALELIGSPEAVRVLKSLATGCPEARLTREAKQSVTRLSRRANIR